MIDPKEESPAIVKDGGKLRAKKRDAAEQLYGPGPGEITPVDPVAVDDSPVDDSRGKEQPVAPELVPLETDADGQCVPGYDPAGFHPTRGPMMVKRSEGS